MGRRPITFLFFIAFAVPVSGATVANYRQRISEAQAGVEVLIAGDRVDRQGIEKIKHLIPSTETIEQDGNRIETSNAWLGAELDRFANESDSTERDAILTAVRERLIAIGSVLDELKKAQATASTKEGEKEKLKEILSRPEYQKAEPKEESLFQKWLKAFEDWLDKVFPRPDVSPKASPAMGSIRLWVQVLIFALALGLIVFLVWRFAPGLFKRSGRGKKEKGDRVILGERVESHESASSLFAEAERLAREGDLRAAIRKGYVALLVELADRKVLGLARHKTNRDYLRDVRKREELFGTMSGLTLNFEKNWYGLRPATAGDWEEFRDGYHAALRRV